MAGFFQEFLKGASDGFFGSEYLRDYQHAAKIFRTNAYGNSPKFKWLFHVYFDINTTLVSQNPAVFPAPQIPGLLVKNINLPKFNITLAEMNQYNRKRYVQTKINYDPISIAFHDDNNSSIRQMWYNYYSYYYNDPTQPRAASGDQIGGLIAGLGVDAAAQLNISNTYSPDICQQQDWGYRGDPSNTSTSRALGITKAPFFKSIKIYGFNQHSFALYELINPIIERFEHDTYDYYQTSGTMENRMTLRYESVRYSQGALNGQNPSAAVQGFGLPANYDQTLSPIAKPGSNRSILGEGGLADAGVGFIQDLQNGYILGAIQKAGTLKNTFKNPQNILQTAKSELIYGVLNATANPQTVRSLFNFPTNSSTFGLTAQQNNSGNFSNPNPPAINTPANTPIANQNPPSQAQAFPVKL
jgi:hypothetical protein